MLDFMRRHARSTAIKVVFWMIIVVFVFWGVGVMVAGGDKVNVAATVDGDVISVQEFQRAYERLERVYQQLYRENFSPQLAAQLNLRQRALDDLVTDRLLKREAARLGLRVDDDEVRETILGIPSFRDSGRFDRQRYLTSLRASRVTPTEFEESQRETLLIGKLESVLTDGVYASDEEVHALFVLEGEKINVGFVKVPFARFRDGVTVSDTEVAEHYEKNKERFRKPERVTLGYVAYKPEVFEATLPVSDEAVVAYYDTHGSDFETPEKVRLRTILLLVPPGADEAARAAVRSRAEGVLAELRAGGDFATLARQRSEDPLTKDAGGDLGLVERGKLEGALEEAAFALEDGQPSDVVEGARGFYLLKVEERQPVGVRPLEEVRDEIVRELRVRGADDAARSALAEDLGRAREGAALEELASARGLTATTSPPVARDQPLAGVKGAVLQSSALELDAGAVDTVEGNEPPYYLFKVVEKFPSTIPPLDEVRNAIVETLRAGKARTLAEREADALLAEARTGGGLAGLAKAAKAKGYTLEETGSFTRSAAIPKLGPAPIKDDLFALTVEAPAAPHAYLLPDAAVAVALKERLAPDESGLSAEKRASLRDSAITRKRQDVLEAYRNLLRQQAEIGINPDVFAGGRG